MNERFGDASSRLVQQIDKIFLNTDLSKLSEGRIQGRWRRHIREIIGHTGNNMYYVDGSIICHGNDQFTREPQSLAPYMNQRRVLYSENRGCVADAARQEQGNTYSHFVEGLPLMSYNERARKLAIQNPDRHKGVYSYTRNDTSKILATQTFVLHK